MLTPADLSLPEKFASWRPGQLQTAAKIAASQKYAFLLDAPTGSGKSLIAAAVQRILSKNMVYCCTTKQLQDQLLHDFPYARTLKGRNNYPCLKYENMFPGVSAEDCTHSKDNECRHHNRCPYMRAKREALSAPLAILNISYFLSEANFVGGFSDCEILVVDECDTLEDQLMSFTQFVITQRQLANLNISPPKYKTKFESWVEWARIALDTLVPQLRELEEEVDSGSWGTVDFALLRRKRNLIRLVSKLKFFTTEVDKTWVWYPGQDRWVFKPVWIAKYASGVLWKHTKRVLEMSATVLDANQLCVNTGLLYSGRKFDYLALPSPFPKEHRPVYYEPCGSVIRKRMDIALPQLALALKKIMDKHPNDRILVHTVSYKVRDYLRRNIKSDRFIVHSTADRDKVLESFKKSTKPLVLLSPSMGRGVDLPDDECRVVVIAKVPYPDLGDPQVNRRVHGSKDGDDWYAHKTVSTIVQASGRACRSMDDYSITYVLDGQFGKIYGEHKSMFPVWYKESVIM